MTSKEALEIVSDGVGFGFTYEEFLEAKNQLLKDLEVLEILKNRVYLNEATIKNYDFAWVEASGFFVFKSSNEYKLLKEWLENDID